MNEDPQLILELNPEQIDDMYVCLYGKRAEPGEHDSLIKENSSCKFNLWEFYDGMNLLKERKAEFNDNIFDELDFSAEERVRFEESINEITRTMQTQYVNAKQQYMDDVLIEISTETEIPLAHLQQLPTEAKEMIFNSINSCTLEEFMKKLEPFLTLPEKNQNDYLKNTELSIEGNYNQIDGIINNLPPQKPSIIEQLQNTETPNPYSGSSAQELSR